MTWTFPPYILFNLLSTTVAFLAVVVNWERRRGRGILMLTFFMVFATLWNVITMVTPLLTNPEIQIVFYTLENLAVDILGAFFLLFVIEYFQSFPWLTKHKHIIIWGIVGPQCLLEVTNPLHHWNWSSYSQKMAGSTPYLVFENQPGTLVLQGITSFVILCALLLLGYAVAFSRGRARSQAVWFLIVFLIPALTYVGFLVSTAEDFTLNTAPIGIALSGLLITYITFRDVHLQLRDRTRELEASVKLLSLEISERKALENDLRQSQATLSDKLAEQSRQLIGLYDLMIIGDEAHPIQNLLTRLVENASAILACDQVAYYPRLTSGLKAHQTPMQSGHLEYLKEAAIQEVVQRYNNGDENIPEILTSELQTCIFKKIEFDGRELGIMAYLWHGPHDFKVDEIALISGMTNLAGIMLENERLRSAVQESARMQERRRLAQDLHDSVTQSLHSLVLSAVTANQIFVKKPENLPDLLKHLSISAAQALKEMRLLLYEMRLQPLLGMNLVDAINLRLASVEHRAATEAILFLDETITWPKEWDTELYPLAVEALNNALKHGRAKKVEVRIGKEQGAFYMTIRDNGRGLDLQSVRPGGMGLQNMNERAKRLGGQLAIKSQPGEGTEITVIIENGAD